MRLTKRAASEFYHVRMVCRGYWTYDLYIPDNAPQFSVGEASSRKDAERRAIISVNSLMTDEQKEIYSTS